MENGIMIRAGCKRHRKILGGIFFLTFLVSAILTAVITIWTNGKKYMAEEIDRAGFGTLTAWVSSVPDLDKLPTQMKSLEQVEEVNTQALIFSAYEANGQESDSDGQLILYQSGEERYKFFQQDLTAYEEAPEEIMEGEVYVSPSLVSMMDVKMGDEVSFFIARNGNRIVLTVAGFYEDPFMGSSMIGMKGFLISEKDYQAMEGIIRENSFDALAREGAMLHVFPTGGQITAAEINQALNENTQLPLYTEFIYSKNAILDYMLILQNAFCGLLLAFSVILLCVVLVVIGHSISGLLEQEYVNFGILKTMGLTGNKLKWLQLAQYMIVIVPGMLAGIFSGMPFSHVVSAMTVTTIGVQIPTKVPIFSCTGVFAGILLLLVCFIHLKLQKMSRITPMKAIRGETDMIQYIPKGRGIISPNRLEIKLAIRQLLSGKKRYLGVCAIAILLTFFASMVGRIDSWIGSDGKGMMDAFNPADHDMGVQALGELDMEEVERTIQSYTNITDRYELAMPDVSIDGINYSANVITEPERFHILQGETCRGDAEVVLTESAASDLGVSIGDSITIRGDKGSSSYRISGIYQCANDMGNNLGLSKEGYFKIGSDNEHLWCYHFFLEDSSTKAEITQTLEEVYGGDIHVHENTWPGLIGIIAAMRMLMIFLYVMVITFILIVSLLTGGKILHAEQSDMGIYKAIGFDTGSLRRTFALRFCIVTFLGSALGVGLAALLTDLLVSEVMKMAGISNFSSHPSFGLLILPLVVVTIAFTYFSWLISGRIKKLDLNLLIVER